jgi:hypothetical protein
MGLNINLIGPREWGLDVRLKRNGRELRKRETFYGTEIQAQGRYLEITAQLSGEGPSKKKPREILRFFGEALKLYRENKGGALPDKEVGRFNSLQEGLEGVSIEYLSERSDVFLRDLRASRPKQYSNESLNKITGMARATLSLALRKELIEWNPLTPSRFPRLKETPR